MPELPEVYTMADVLGKVLDKPGIEIDDIEIHWEKLLDKGSCTIQDIASHLKHEDMRREFSSYGKHLFMGVHDADKVNPAYPRYIVFQMGMSGLMQIGVEHPTKHTRARLVFKREKNGIEQKMFIGFEDQRKFGRLTLWKGTIDEYVSAKKLGRDVRLGTQEELAKILISWSKKKPRMPVKEFMMRQDGWCGIGNYLASEIGFASKLHPELSLDAINPTQLKTLCKVTKEKIDFFIAEHGNSLRNYRQPDGSEGSGQKRMLVYGREDQPCFTCQSIIVAKEIAGRNTFWCNTCQPLEK